MQDERLNCVDSAWGTVGKISLEWTMSDMSQGQGWVDPSDATWPAGWCFIAFLGALMAFSGEETNCTANRIGQWPQREWVKEARLVIT